MPGGYQKQLAARVRISREQGVELGLPTLCDRLQLTLFEKNLLILGLAPEVNSRYARLYAYLQDNEASPLPQVDLALKLLCRNDQEWYKARHCLAEASPLVQQGLISLLAPTDQPLLSHRIKLAAPLVNYLLANPLPPQALESLMDSLAEGSPAARRSPPPAQATLPIAGSADPWRSLVLPRELKRELKHLSQRLSLLATNPPAKLAIPKGTWAILAGPSGTGKRTAARAIAQTAQTALLQVDLDQYDLGQLAHQLQHWQRQAPTVLLMTGAERLLGAQSPLGPEILDKFLHQRQQQPCLTLFTVTLIDAVARRWRQQCDRLLIFPLPDSAARVRLWKQAFAKGAKVDSKVSWEQLAEQGRLTSPEIQAIAQDAALYAQLEGKTTRTGKACVNLRHIQRAWQQRQSGRG